MKGICYVVFVMFFFSCQGQGVGKNNETDTAYTLLEEKIEKSNNDSFLERYLTKYIDSLNIADRNEKLPYFLNDTQLDYHNKGAWPSFHSPISVRAQIINRINSCRLLQMIAQSPNENYKRKPEVEGDLRPPLIDLSLHDLVVKRMEVLECK